MFQLSLSLRNLYQINARNTYVIWGSLVIQSTCPGTISEALTKIWKLTPLTVSLFLQSLWELSAHHLCWWICRSLVCITTFACWCFLIRRLITFRKTFTIFIATTKSTFTWDLKWTQTGLTSLFQVKFHFGGRYLHYQRSHDFRQSETHFGANFTSVNLTEVKFQTAVSFPCTQ